MVASKQTIRGMDTTTQASGPKDWQAQAYEGLKAQQKPRSSQTNMDVKHKSKQASIHIHKRNDPNPLM